MTARRLVLSSLALFGLCLPAVADSPRPTAPKPEPAVGYASGSASYPIKRQPEENKDLPPVQVQLDVVIARIASSRLRRDHADLCKEWEALLRAPIGDHNYSTGLGKQEKYLKCLEKLRKAGVVKLLAEPRLVTMNGRAATFLSGGEQAIPHRDAEGAVKVEYMPFGTRLTFLPFVLPNGKIYVEAEPEISEPYTGSEGDKIVYAGRSTFRLHTSCEIEDGQTFVVVVRKPGVTSKKGGDMVVLMTPHVSDPMNARQKRK